MVVRLAYLGAILIAVAIAPRVSADGSADSSGYKTIEELYSAYAKATEHHDWKALFLLGTPMRQDCDILMLAVTAATSQDATLRGFVDRHGADWRQFDHAWTDEDNQRLMRDGPALAASLAKQVRRKPELFAAAQSYIASKNDPSSTKPRELKHLVRQGPTAVGESVEIVTCIVRTFDAVGNRTEQYTQTHTVVSRLWFRQIDGRWYLATEKEPTDVK